MSSTLTHQLCLIYRTLIKAEIKSTEKAGYLIVHIFSTQKQIGDSDFSLFAIVVAFHTSLSHFMSDLEFDQVKMISHLLKCLTERKFTPFPTLDNCSMKLRSLYPDIDAFCSCLIPDTYSMEI